MAGKEMAWTAVTIAQSGTESSEVDLGENYKKLLVEAPDLNNAEIRILVSRTTSGTFQTLYTWATTSTTKVKSTATSSAKTYIFPLGDFQFIKLQVSASQTSAERTFYIKGIKS